VEIRTFVRACRILAALAAVWLGSASPASAIDIDQIAIDRGVGQASGVGSWFVEISVTGIDLRSAVLSSGACGSITLSPVGTSGELRGGMQFADLAALDAAFPIGSWTLDVNAGELVGGLAYDPLILPNGSAPIASPAFADGDVSLTPLMLVDNHCSNCQLYSGSTAFGPTALVGRIASLGNPTPLETIIVSPDTTQIGFGNALQPGGQYRFETSVATNNYLPLAFGVDAFHYYQLWTETESTEFSTAFVPEPGTALLLSVGLVALSARRRSRTRR